MIRVRRKTPNLRSRASQHVGVLVRALLILWSAWNGPLPWCHSHGTLANASIVDQNILREHLRSHHAFVEPTTSDVDFGWHFHMELPSEGHGAPERLHLRQMIATAGGSGLDGTIRVAGVSEGTATYIGSLAAQRPNAQSEGNSPVTHFFDGFAANLSLPLRFGVLRC